MPSDKRFEVKQSLLFMAIPVTIDTAILIGAIISHGILRFLLLGILVALLYLLYKQLKPTLTNFKFIMTPKFIRIENFKGDTVREVDWKKVEAAAAGYKVAFKKIYFYNFYFRIKKEEDLIFAVTSTQPDLAAKFQQFIKVFVRKKIPIQIVKP
ncbi:hypothetical protein [Desulfurobacterium atlanticum]|uniref:Uncharacterized protein n=1 Tax=Desulfurobacterium atlanticum TaxID=240169 RepID=A0A238YNK1_9BACT|nr:hypothetical protein [Desulfurobacterium atlanticum]SNR72163.1 hypothetical protein SAMN06265340_10428 [Desulfurobacterium atlanticum]